MSDPRPDDPARLDRSPGEGSSDDALARTDDEDLPVVARMMVEIRSDGTRTVARGALEELTSGQQVALEAEAGSPAELSAKLLKGLLASPLLAAASLKRNLLGDGRRGLRQRIKDRLLPFRGSE